MSDPTITIRSNRVVTPDGVVQGRVTISGQRIIDIQTGADNGSYDQDWGDDVLMPGMIDIHTDNLEKHFMPRAGTQWDAVGAAMAHDGQMATAGVTTVFDSLSLHGEKNGLDRGKALPMMMDGVETARQNGALRVDHKLHLRCEVSNPSLFDLLDPFMDHKDLSMLSIMDHTPGQGQMGSIDAWTAKQVAKGKTEAEIKAHLNSAMSWRDVDGAPEKRRGVAERANSKGIPLASHDDDSREAVKFAAELGVTISEFPVCFEAAEAAQEYGMVSVMGSPNFVRGGSHSGNASARDILDAGLLHGLCSDYVPLSMLRSAFMMAEAPFNMSLDKAISLVAEVPAKMSNLHDRGKIQPGLRADMLRVHYKPGTWPVIREVWAAGTRVS